MTSSERARPPVRPEEGLRLSDREVVGTVCGGGYVRPLHDVGLKRIHLSKEQAADLRPGQSVLLRVSMPDWPKRDLRVELVSTLSPERNSGTDYAIEVALRAHNVPAVFPEKARQAARALRGRRLPAEGRVDLRDLPFVTIDDESAKDFDDAIACQANEAGWRLWVAIADVSAYVEPNSALDREAQRRGNSVYFANGRCVPMLPAELSEDLCSLRPHCDRLALAASMQLSTAGELLDFQFVSALIRSRARLSYAQVGDLFDSGKEGKLSSEISDALMTARQAYRRLSHCRERRGALNIDLPEPVFLFAKKGRVRAIVKKRVHDAHKMIEEFMICANVCAARFARQHKKKFLYRVHYGVKDDARKTLEAFLAHRNLFLQGHQTKAIKKLIDGLKGRSDTHVIQSFILRSLSAAVYQMENQGHFGLALSHYAHYTSPIRRYPDLILHRALRSALDLPGAHTASDPELKRLGQHCSMTEKRADEVSRDINRYLQCVYAEDKIGQIHNGMVVGVAAFGLFVELETLNIEGLLHVSRIGHDYYLFSEEKQCLMPRHRGPTYNLGDWLRVKIIYANPQERKIGFRMA